MKLNEKKPYDYLLMLNIHEKFKGKLNDPIYQGPKIF